MPVKKKKKKGKKPRGKSKGSANERDVKRLILKAFKPFGITENDAFRSILSGGHQESFGDISLSSGLAKLFPFGVEAKFYRKINLYALFSKWDKIIVSSHFKEWWKQACDGTAKCKHLYPLLVFKGNNQDHLCMVYAHHLCYVASNKKNPLVKREIPHFIHYTSEGEVWILKFSVLLKLLVNKAKKGQYDGK